MQELERLQGMVETVTFENKENGFAVLHLVEDSGDMICAVGPLAGCVPGEELVLDGHYTEHPTYGVQFEAEACAFRLPENENAILKYLSSGALPGIGPATARRIVEKFGEESLEVLASAPEKLAGVRGFTLGKAQEASRKFLEMFNVREAMAALGRYGLSAMEALALYRRYEKGTLDLLAKNPYILCGHPLYLAFQRVDAIADSFQMERQSAERSRAALLYTLRHNLNNGHACLARGKLLETSSGFFGIEPGIMEDELDTLEAEGLVNSAQAGEECFVYLGDMYRAEMNAAMHIRGMVGTTFKAPPDVERQISLREEAEGIRYAPLQKDAIKLALESGVMVLTGGPGTGKTTTINGIIALFEQQAERVFLAAPTGRAAKRLSELTGRKAQTIHRLLEAEFSPTAEFPRFRRNSENPLRCDVLILDEMSMVDALLFESVLAALKPHCRLVLVGDADQLPSVGAGNVLRGILQSGVVPVVALTEIFRQAAESLIVRNAHAIVEGTKPQSGGKKDDFFFLPAWGPGAQQLVCDLVAQRLPASYGFSPVNDIQVLCPGRRWALGTEVLGARLQELLNPPAEGKPEMKYGGTTFRLGDKVMQVRNNYDIPFTRLDGEPGAGAFNGDIGVIEEMNPKTGSITVLCEDRRVLYTTENLRELELAYAITIHKSQGSEFEAVVIPLSEVPNKLQYRNLLYTGVTRAKRLCVLVGEVEIMEHMVRNGKRNTRFSCFAHFLQDEEWM